MLLLADFPTQAASGLKHVDIYDLLVLKHECVSETCVETCVKHGSVGVGFRLMLGHLLSRSVLWGNYDFIN